VVRGQLSVVSRQLNRSEGLLREWPGIFARTKQNIQKMIRDKIYRIDGIKTGLNLELTESGRLESFKA
jgi:hypothetical protein